MLLKSIRFENFIKFSRNREFTGKIFRIRCDERIKLELKGIYARKIISGAGEDVQYHFAPEIRPVVSESDPS